MKMRLTIIGASGGVGRQLVEQAAAGGHDVTAVVRNPRRLSRGVRSVTVDLANPDLTLLQAAIRGADAVLSGLGPRSAADVGVAARGTRSIMLAMNSVSVKRIVVVSAAPIGTVPSPGRPNPPKYDPGDGFLVRHLLAPLTKVALRRHYADLAAMEDVLRESGTDWTVVRPPRLTDGRLTNAYRISMGSNLLRGLSISRADVADFMLRAVEDRTTVKQTVGIAN